MNTTIKRISLVAGIVALVLVAGWYLALFSPQSRDLSKAHKAHSAAEQKIAQLQGQVVQLNALKSQIPAEKAALSQLQADVPDTPQLSSVLRQLHAAAINSGVQLSMLNPSTPTTTPTSSGQKSSSTSSSSSSGTPSITLQMTAAGSYPQLTSFLTQLATMPRVLVVNSLSIAGGPDQLAAQITANIFYTGA